MDEFFVDNPCCCTGTSAWSHWNAFARMREYPCCTWDNICLTRLSLISIFTKFMSVAFRSSGTARCQWECSLRTPRAGTSQWPLTYGVFFQAFVFLAAGRLITIRPLPFFGPGKLMNLDAMKALGDALTVQQGKSRFARAKSGPYKNAKTISSRPKQTSDSSRQSTGEPRIVAPARAIRPTTTHQGTQPGKP